MYISFTEPSFTRTLKLCQIPSNIFIKTAEVKKMLDLYSFHEREKTYKCPCGKGMVSPNPQ